MDQYSSHQLPAHSQGRAHPRRADALFQAFEELRVSRRNDLEVWHRLEPAGRSTFAAGCCKITAARYSISLPDPYLRQLALSWVMWA